MPTKYNLYFVPVTRDRKKMTPLRSKLCKETHSTQALIHPIHMTLVKGDYVKNYKKLEKDLIDLCKNQKPFILESDKNTDVLPDRFWSGISIKESKELKDFQEKLEKLFMEHSVRKKKHRWVPHITLTFPAKVKYIKPSKNPVQKMLFERLTIVKKYSENEGYKIHKHIKF